MAERNKKRECAGATGVDLERLKCRTLGAGRLPSGHSVTVSASEQWDLITLALLTLFLTGLELVCFCFFPKQ